MLVGVVKWAHGLLILLPLVSLWQNRDVWLDIDAVTPLGLLICVIGSNDPVSRIALMGSLIFLWDFGRRASVSGVCPVQWTDVQNCLNGTAAGEHCPAQFDGTYELWDYLVWNRGLIALIWDLCCEIFFDGS